MKTLRTEIEEKIKNIDSEKVNKNKLRRWLPNFAIRQPPVRERKDPTPSKPSN